MKIFLLLTACLTASCPLFGQKYLSYGMMTEAIRQTVHEHELQENARTEQVQVAAWEERNKEEMGKIKKTYTQILERLNKMGLIVDAAFLINEVYPEVQHITESQKQLFGTVKQYPEYVYLVAEHEYYLVKKAQSLLNYMTGLTLSAVDVAGMKQGERMILLQHVRNEILTISSLARRMQSIVHSKIWQDRLKKQKALQWINREKDIINDILRNANDVFK